VSVSISVTGVSLSHLGSDSAEYKDIEVAESLTLTKCSSPASRKTEVPPTWAW